MQTISSRFPPINRIPGKFSVTMESLIEFESSPMVSPIETMHFDSTFTNPIGLHRFLPHSELHFDEEKNGAEAHVTKLRCRLMKQSLPNHWTYMGEVELATMGGSKGGKHSKGKGKSNLMKNETSHTTPEALNSKHDLAQPSNDNATSLPHPTYSKGKGKSNLMKNETGHTTPEALNSKHDLAQTSNDKAQGLGDSEVKSPDPRTKASSRYTVNDLEEFLLLKLEDLYTKAKGWLLTSGYSMADVERAILNNGYVHGPKDLLTNVLANTVAFMKQKVEPKGKAFEDMKELYKAMLEALIDSALRTEPKLQRTEAMWLLLVRKWGGVPSTSRPSGVLSRDGNTDSIKDGSSGGTSHSSNEGTSAPDLSSIIEKSQSELNIESSSKKVGILERINTVPALASQIRQDVPIVRATVQREIGTIFIEQQDLQNAGCALIEGSNLDSDILTFLDEECVKRWKKSSPNDLKTAFIVDLIKSIRDLDEKVKVHKKWAQKKVVDSAKRLSKDLLELNMLKQEKVETQRLKDEKLCAESSCMLMLKETEQSLRNVNCEASAISESIRTLELSNAHIGADTEALRLSASEYGNELNKVLSREMKCMKKLATIGKQTSNLRASCGEERQKVLQLQLDVFQAEKEAKEAEDKWMQEIKEKEWTLALLAEETRKAGPFKANLEAKLSDIRQSIEIDKSLKKEEVKWLERDLSRLRMFHQLSNVSLEGDTFLFDGIEVSSLEPSALHEPPKHWDCMICFTNEVSVVFLPCTHQVLCTRCYEGRCSSSASRQHCPYCGAEVQECIKAYAPT